MIKQTAITAISIAALNIGFAASAEAQVNLLENSSFEDSDGFRDFEDWEESFVETSDVGGAFDGEEYAFIDSNLDILEQSIIVPDTDQLYFGAWVRAFAFGGPNGQDDFFDLLTVTLQVDDSLSKQIEVDVDNDYQGGFTPVLTSVAGSEWFKVEGALDVSGLGGESALLKFGFENTTQFFTSFGVDQAFVFSKDDTQAVSEPTSLLGLLIIGSAAAVGALKQRACA